MSRHAPACPAFRHSDQRWSCTCGATPRGKEPDEEAAVLRAVLDRLKHESLSRSVAGNPLRWSEADGIAYAIAEIEAALRRSGSSV